jgi:hypothetical protein
VGQAHLVAVGGAGVADTDGFLTARFFCHIGSSFLRWFTGQASEFAAAGGKLGVR